MAIHTARRSSAYVILMHVENNHRPHRSTCIFVHEILLALYTEAKISTLLMNSVSKFLFTLPRHLPSPCIRNSIVPKTTSCPRFPSLKAQSSLQITRVPVRYKMTDTNQGGDSSKKTYHKKATGNALMTVKNHSKEDDLKLYGSAFW
jgi:hypothetical protein